MPHLVEDTPVSFIIGVRNGLPIELEKGSIFMLVNISIVYSLYTLELYSQDVFEGSLWMWMPKWVSCPAYLHYIFEFLMEEVHADSILINDVIIVADCFIVFNPSTVSNLKLSIFQQLRDLILFLFVQVIIPILKENNLCYEVLPVGRINQGIKHGVEDSFRVPLVHGIEEPDWSKVDIFELFIGVEPKCIKMGMKGD